MRRYPTRQEKTAQLPTFGAENSDQPVPGFVPTFGTLMTLTTHFSARRRRRGCVGNQWEHGVMEG
jgi:hypothetical protein